MITDVYEYADRPGVTGSFHELAVSISACVKIGVGIECVIPVDWLGWAMKKLVGRKVIVRGDELEGVIIYAHHNANHSEVMVRFDKDHVVELPLSRVFVFDEEKARDEGGVRPAAAVPTARLPEAR